jgi:RsiW-degrading membrane proteinase PrsW (M82 family)
MIIIYIIIAIFIAWIWVDYYRLIDIYESESLKYFILTFFLGCASVLIVIGLNRYILDKFPFELNGDFVNDFLYSVFRIGLVEEFAKTIPFLIVYFLFRKQFNEPIDYLAFICIAALGFSAAENVQYFRMHGPYIINSRAILATVGHMFDTSLIAYGIIRYKYYSKKSIIGLLAFIFLAALSHGFYDFW